MTASEEASEELRRMLDERGVEWWDDSSIYGTRRTVWKADGVTFVAAEVSGRLKVSGYLTPEQAIEATLGLETCKARLYKRGYGFSDCTKCECGEVNDISAIYCNRCGRRIEVEL